MVRILAILLLFALPNAAVARCDGTDLIAKMPEVERAALIARAGNEAFAEGLLWKAVRGETEITFFGTYHFPHEDTQAHLEAVTPYIEAADQVYLEVSNADSAKMERDMAADPSLMFIMEGPTLPDLLGDEDWALFAAEMRARGIAPFFAAKFKPLWATMMLGIGPCEARSGALEAHGIDKLVGDYAAEIGNPSRSLEQFGELMRLLDEEPVDKQIDLIRLTLAWPGDTDDLSYTIRQRYLAEEIALTWEFSRLISLKYGGSTAEEDFQRMSDMLLERRNADWIDLLLREAPGKRVFIAAGAGHLPGDIGVLYLLEQEGFTIERLPMPRG